MFELDFQGLQAKILKKKSLLLVEIKLLLVEGIRNLFERHRQDPRELPLADRKPLRVQGRQCGLSLDRQAMHSVLLPIMLLEVLLPLVKDRTVPAVRLIVNRLNEDDVIQKLRRVLVVGVLQLQEVPRRIVRVPRAVGPILRGVRHRVIRIMRILLLTSGRLFITLHRLLHLMVTTSAGLRPLRLRTGINHPRFCVLLTR